MRNHRTTAHRTPEQGGSVARRGRRRANQEKDPLTVPHPVYCQRLAPFGTYSYYFAVTPDSEELLESRTLVPEIDEATFIQAQVGFALLRSNEIADAEDRIAPTENDATETSLWLELTRWPEYIRGHGFFDVAKLAYLPDFGTEPILVAIERSVKRLVNRAFESILSYRINKFDQVRINSFIQKPNIWERPIQIKLRPKTYNSYCQI